MKRLLKIVVLLLLLVGICSCREKKEYYAVELTGEELARNIFTDDKKSFVFAMINEDKSDTEQFIKDLGSLAKSSKKNVYYVNYSHIDTDSSFYLFNIDAADFANNSYYAYDNGNFVKAEYYTDYATMYQDLKNFNNNGEIEYIADDVKKNYLEEANTLYAEGKISMAFDSLNKAWSLDEAKDIYKSNKYYKLLIAWEFFDFKDKELTELTYYSLIFYHGVPTFSVASKEGKYEKDYDKTFYPEAYQDLFYYVKDDIIYTSKSEDGKYSKTYEITRLDSNHLEFKDLKTKKEYNYVRRQT